jgi:hypothetical protein
MDTLSRAFFLEKGISFEKPFLNIKDAQQSVMDSFEKGEGKHA